MRRVSLVCSVHRETGLATAAELYWLLARLRPDVLFLERSSADFPAFLDGSCGTLESAAVRRYRNLHTVELVPVDLYLNAAESKQKDDDLFDRIDRASPRYGQLALANLQHTAKGGFAYLNSPTSALLQSEMQREMRATVRAVGEPTLAELYTVLTRTNDLREQAMLSGVEAFAKKASFTRGVLLVGAAHRQSLFEKAQLPRSDGPYPVRWHFDWELEETALEGDLGPGRSTTHGAALRLLHY
jgi:hypothetical protein